MRYSPERCFGCLTCQMICSLGHEGACRPSDSRVVPGREGLTFAMRFTDECDECGRCAAFCPSGAIREDGPAAEPLSRPTGERDRERST